MAISVDKNPRLTFLGSEQSLLEHSEGIKNSEMIIYFDGGYGFNKERNYGVGRNIIDGLGRAAHFLALPDPSEKSNLEIPINYTVSFRNGDQIKMGLLDAYRRAPDPDIISITSSYQEERADILARYIKESGAQGRVDAILQSAGALYGVIAACKEPDLFRNIVLAYPAGMVKKEKVTQDQRRIAKSIPKKIIEWYRQHQRTEESRATEPFREYWQRVRDTRGAAVAASTAVCYQSELLHGLRERDDVSLPGISLVLGLRDVLMPPEGIIKSLKSINDVDLILVTNTSHGIKRNEKVLDEILKLFPAMEDIKVMRRAGKDISPIMERVLFTTDVSDDDRQSILECISQLDDN